MLFLTEEDIAELSEKAGVRFPITEARWMDFCYICCWVGVKKRLPDPIHNRMMLGEQNEWTRIYANMSAIRHPHQRRNQNMGSGRGYRRIHTDEP